MCSFIYIIICKYIYIYSIRVVLYYSKYILTNEHCFFFIELIHIDYFNNHFYLCKLDIYKVYYGYTTVVKLILESMSLD